MHLVKIFPSTPTTCSCSREVLVLCKGSSERHGRDGWCVHRVRLAHGSDTRFVPTTWGTCACPSILSSTKGENLHVLLFLSMGRQSDTFKSICIDTQTLNYCNKGQVSHNYLSNQKDNLEILGISEIVGLPVNSLQSFGEQLLLEQFLMKTASNMTYLVIKCMWKSGQENSKKVPVLLSSLHFKPVGK